MHQLIYVSEARPGLGSEELFHIIEQSARNNPNAEITGFLVMREGRFLQLIEGPLMALEALLARLSGDDRHHGIQVLSRISIATRSFPRWRMKRVGNGADALDELETALRAEGHDHTIPAAVRSFVTQRLAA